MSLVLLLLAGGAPAWPAASWAPTAPPQDWITSVVVDPSRPGGVYALAGEKSLLRTLDGGATWSVDDAAFPAATGLTVLTIDPTRPAILYIAANEGVFKTTDGGASWKAASAGLPANPAISALVVDPLHPMTVFADASAGIFRTLDGGLSWSAVRFTPPNELPVHALAIAPTEPATLYAAARYGAFKTTDGGATWNKLDLPADIDLDLFTLAVDPLHPSTIVIGAHCHSFKSEDEGRTFYRIADASPVCVDANLMVFDPSHPGTIYLGSHGIMRSTDGGARWRKVTPLDTSALALDSRAPGTIWAGTDRGIFKSLDGGASWRNLDARVAAIHTVAIDPARPATLYASATGHIFKSLDAGASWTEAVDDSRERRPRWDDVGVLAVDPVNASTVYAGAEEGLYRSTDGGASWTVLEEGPLTKFSTIMDLAMDPAHPDALYVSVLSDGILRSVDGGLHWCPSDAGPVHDAPGRPFGNPNFDGWVGALSVARGNTVYGGGCNVGPLKSHDGGATWAIISSGLPAVSSCATRLVASSADPQTLYVALNTDAGPLGVFKSTDGGAHWRPVSTFPLAGAPLEDGGYQGYDPCRVPRFFGGRGPYASAITDLAVDPGNSQILYVARSPTGIWKTIDGGERWKQVNAGLTVTEVSALAIDPVHATTLYAATSSGVFKTVDGGAHWAAASCGLTDSYGVPAALCAKP